MLRMALFICITSKAGTCSPSTSGSSCWDTTVRSTELSCTRIWACWAGGKESMIRSMVFTAPRVCRVAMSRWPVSAAVMAVWMVSWSRISPNKITSGAWRRQARRAER